jgi:hypothetical protein
MKAKPQTAPVEPGEEDIREYAYHLYVQSGCAPGRDLANWTEARAFWKNEVKKDKKRGIEDKNKIKLKKK